MDTQQSKHTSLHVSELPAEIHGLKGAPPKPKTRCELESIYKADEVKRQRVAKALLENPVATSAMMSEMRTRESTGDRCLRNNAISIPPGSNFIQKINELESISAHDADRLRRLLDYGCPMAIVFWLAEFTNCHADRNHFITEEEAKLFLEPLENRSN
jgi:hypothetical protein